MTESRLTFRILISLNVIQVTESILFRKRYSFKAVKMSMTDFATSSFKLEHLYIAKKMYLVLIVYNYLLFSFNSHKTKLDINQ